MSTIATAPVTLSPARTTRVRLDSIDFVRGMVMVIMALDHVRDYYSNFRGNPMDPAQTWLAMYLTRWITHYCAPTFVLLAGAGSYLYGSRRTKAELTRFLWTRGLWLVLLEVTVVRIGFGFDWGKDSLFAQVIWAIGWSMVLLAALVRLPVKVVGGIGVAIIALHNLFDRVPAETFGALAPLYRTLMGLGPVPLGGGASIFIAYPVLPWFGVLATGYALGSLFTADPEDRRATLRKVGLAAIAAFFVIRGINVYGDQAVWTVQKTTLQTVMSFFNCSKYPPSLDYLLMTLGPSILILGMLPDKLDGLAKPFVTFGRVPMFYYILHAFLLHAGSAILAVRQFGDAPWMFHGIPNSPVGLPTPEGWGWGLAGVYMVWAVLVLILYPLCAWFAKVKQRRHDPWLSYL